MGKTRVAARFVAAQKQPTWCCDLTDARNHADVVCMVAATVGAPLTPGIDDAVAQVGRYLAAGPQRLIVLDNFEQVASCAAETVGVWPALAPNVVFLVTSRERLQLP